MSLVVSLLAGLFGLSGLTLFLGFIVAAVGGQTDTALFLFAGTGACISIIWLISLMRAAPEKAPDQPARTGLTRTP